MEGLAKYTQEWMPQEEVLLPFYQGIASYVEKTLDHERHGDGQKLETKIIADPLMGYILVP